MKTFISLIHFDWNTSVTVNSSEVSIRFTNGIKNSKNGVYHATSQAISDAMEKDKRYGTYFIDINHGTNQEVAEPEMKFTQVTGINTAQEAKDYLEENFKDVKISELKNKAIVLQMAESKGIIFTDLK